MLNLINLGVGMVIDPDLNADRLSLPKIISPARWEVTSGELELSSFSNAVFSLLRTSSELDCQISPIFIPLRNDEFEEGELYYEFGDRENLCPTEITLRASPSSQGVAAALDSLESLLHLQGGRRIMRCTE
jgi:hypothetical protein